MGRVIRRIDVLVFLLLLGSFAWFRHSEPGWNVNSRFALALAMAETGSPQVERYVARPGLYTEDLAEYKGHLYSDKSIGTSVLGVPAVWAVQAIEAAAGTTFSTPTRLYLVTLLSVGLAGALSGVLLMRWLSLLWWGRERDPNYEANGERRFLAAVTAIGITLGTMLFLHATLFMSYLPANACLLAMLLLLEIALRGGHPRVGLIFCAGLAGGLAALCEYTYAAAAAFSGVYLASRLLARNGYPGATVPKKVTSLGAYALGGVIGIAPFLIYTISIFGRPTVPYQYHVMPQFRAAMAQGFMGATWPPDPDVLWLITFHPFRGIFVYSPALLLGFVGLIWMAARDQLRRGMARLCLAAGVFYLLFNSAYYMWWGGWSFSPRHLAPAIPFLAAGLWPWLQQRWGRWLAVVAMGAGVVVHLLVNATEPQTPDGGWQAALLRPDLAAFDYPAVFVRQTVARIMDGAFDVNLGSLAGLPQNLWSLLPLLGWWLLMGALLWRESRRA